MATIKVLPPRPAEPCALEATVSLETGRTGTIEIGARGSRCGEPLTLLVESIAPTPRMLVFGAIDFAAALVRIGKYLGYHVTVCDARPLFATPARFPEADEVVADWPHRYLASQAWDARTVICVLTHDAKFDVPLLQRALRLPIAYIGAMGSRRTHLQRLGLLRESGVTEAELARLHSAGADKSSGQVRSLIVGGGPAATAPLHGLHVNGGRAAS